MTCDCGHAAIDHHGCDPKDGCLGVASHKLPACSCTLTYSDVRGDCSKVETTMSNEVPDPCPSCGWQYEPRLLEAATRGEVALDPNPAHLCRPGPAHPESPEIEMYLDDDRIVFRNQTTLDQYVSDVIAARLAPVREYVDDPGNWSTLDGRRRTLLALIDASAEPSASR